MEIKKKRFFIKNRWLTMAGVLLLVMVMLAGCGSPVIGGEGTNGGSIEAGDDTAIQQEEQEPSEDVQPKETDEYLTEPVPEGEPAPVEPQHVTVDKVTTGICTISIECGTILNNMGSLIDGKSEMIPEDGVILAPTEVTFHEGENVFDVLKQVTRDRKIHMEFSNTPIYNSAYIEGIYNLYEFDCGGLSGWVYEVNGWFPNYGCSRYSVKDGDVIHWYFTCDLGRDVGNDSGTMQKDE